MTYTSVKVFEAIEQIASTSSKNEKIAILGEHIHDSLMQQVLKAALDPTVSYGVTGIKGRDITGTDDDAGAQFDDTTWHVINGLASRRLTGNDAQAEIEKEINRLDAESSQLFARVLNMDLRAGFGESTVNKVKPGLIPEFPYMRCSLPKAAKLDQWDWARGVFSQEKADGMFVNVDHYEDGSIAIRSRQGSPFDPLKFPGVASIIRHHTKPGYELHGEMLVIGPDDNILPREQGNGVLNSVLSGGDFEPGQRPMMVAWDQVPLSMAVPKGKCDTPYMERFGALADQLAGMKEKGAAVIPIDTRIVHSLDEAYAHYRELLAQGKEGTIIKSPKAIWKDGTSKEQVKLKLEVDVDLVATEIVPGTVGTKNEGRPGSIKMQSSCGRLVVDVTIKNEALRDAIERDPSVYLSKVWAVRANSIMKPAENDGVYSLFLPRMVEAGYRTDKSAADSLRSIQDQFEAAVKAA
jgi:DNA ligase-1